MHLEKYFFALTIFAALVLTFFLLQPFGTYLVLAGILTYYLGPLKRYLRRYMPSEALCAAILVVLVILVVVAPSIYVTSHLVTQVSSAYNDFKDARIGDRLGRFVQQKTGRDIEFHRIFLNLLESARNFLLGAAPNVLGSLTSLVVGLFIMFFVIYYALQESGELGRRLRRLIPLEAGLKDKMLEEIRGVLEGVLYGQVITAVVVGALEGIGFLIFGVGNAIFWAVMMMILSFIPVLGTPLIWVPAGIYLIVEGHLWRGLGLLVFSTVVVVYVDNFLKPRLISDKSRIHPIIILIGVLGGLELFGFIGLVIGPLVLALLIRLLVFYEEVYLPKQAGSKADS
ncbi:MAG: AI-2E family transporter [Acidobacteriia bacterium]|nr:AI-2E family transporter [Terriglobia bacterium]